MGDNDGGGGDDDSGGSIFPGHPGPIPNAPRDNISRKGIPSLRPVDPIKRIGLRTHIMWIGVRG